MLYKELAPIPKEAWDEMEERLMEVFKTYLSARKVVRVEGPRGLQYNVISQGRLGDTEEDGDLCYGTYQVLPLTEVRVEFKMDKWELDNILRGAKDIDYEPLEEAAKKIALFEENAIYNGLESAHIKGMVQIAEGGTIDFGKDPRAIMDSIATGLIKLKEVYQEGPFTLIVGEEAYKRIISTETGYPLKRRIEELIDNKIIYSHVLDGALLVPYDHEDLELTLGEDLSLGYQYNDNREITFFITESFTFRVLDPSIIVKYNV